METYLQNLTDWATLNDMQLNTAKTKEMILGPRGSSQPAFAYYYYNNNSSNNDDDDNRHYS